jgi:modulator of FtsH protease HflK
MAWNDSGGSGDRPGGSGNGGPRNPWGKRPQQGPPDLDQLFRNLQRKLAALFGGGSTGGPRSGDGVGGPGGISIGVVLLGVLVVWLLTGFYQNTQAERAVIMRFGKFAKVTGPGLNWRFPWPIDSRILVNIERIDSYTDQTRMLTTDENLVDINLAVQFRRAEPMLYVFKVNDPDATLKEVSESAIREIVGRSDLVQVLGPGRQEIAARTKDLIQRTLRQLEAGIEVTSVNLQGVAVPEQVAPAQQDAIKAGNDKERATVEAQTYARDILPRAQGAAVRQVQDAQAYRARKIADSEGETQRFLKLLTEYERAPAVTRQRLYLETVEEVFARSKKVVVDSKGTGNMLYLPIDKLIEQSGGASRETSRDPIPVSRAPNSTSTMPETTVEDRRLRGAR